MSKDFPQPHPGANTAHKTNGLLYGLFGGLVFALAAWGYDAFLLAQTSYAMPWLKILAGGGLVIGISGLVGWAAGRHRRFLGGIPAWGLAGAIFALIAARLPYLSFSVARDLSKTGWFPLTHYPFPAAFVSRMWVIVAVVALLFVLAGLLQRAVTTSSASAATKRGWLSVVVGLGLLLAGAGYLVDSSLNRPLREPVLATHTLFQLSLSDEGQAAEPDAGSAMHLAALQGVKTKVAEPYRLWIGDYDDDLTSVSVLAGFEGGWVRCTVVFGQPIACQDVTENDEIAALPDQVGNLPAQTGPAADTPIPTHTSTALPAASQTPASPSPSPAAQIIQPEEQELPDFPRYNIEVEIDFANQSFSGYAQVEYTNLEDVPLDRLYFRLLPNGQLSYGNGFLDAGNVKADGQTVETGLSLDDSVLEIILPNALEPGQMTFIEMDFTGQAPTDFGGSTSPSGYGIYNYSDGVLALANWYPILAVYDADGWNLDPVSFLGDSVYSEMANYTVDLTVRTDVVVAATGVAVESETSGENTRYRFESGLARDFFLIMSPDFQVVSKTVDGTQINSYYLPGHEAGGASALEVGAVSLAVFNERFGPYPYGELDIVGAPMRNAAGVEYPGIVLVADFLYDNYERPDFIITTAHEVAHQWWYSTVGNDVFDEPWLDEALTTYSSSMYYEAIGTDTSGLITHWGNRYELTVAQGDDDLVTQSLAYFESLGNPRVYGAVVYTKGALFFAALREEIGDEAFFAALQSYYRAYQFRIATADDLLSTFEQASGRQLDDLYQTWLYSASLPSQP